MRAALAARLLLVLVLTASTQSLLLTRGAFELRREAITERLCVNRDRPELDCNGSCVLSRMMHEQHDREDRHTQAVLEVALSVTALVADPETVAAPEPANLAAPNPGPVLAFAEGVRVGVDRPPPAA